MQGGPWAIKMGRLQPALKVCYFGAVESNNFSMQLQSWKFKEIEKVLAGDAGREP